MNRGLLEEAADLVLIVLLAISTVGVAVCGVLAVADALHTGPWLLVPKMLAALLCFGASGMGAWATWDLVPRD